MREAFGSILISGAILSMTASPYISPVKPDRLRMGLLLRRGKILSMLLVVFFCRQR
jgi:hypothetical protein